MAFHGVGYPHENRPHEICVNRYAHGVGNLWDIHIGILNVFLEGVAYPMKQDCFPVEFIGGGPPHGK